MAAAVLERVKNAIVPKRDDSALIELRKLLDRHDQIASFNNQVLALLSQYGRRLQSARAELNLALRSLDLSRAEKAIADLVDAQARAQIADAEFQALNRLQTMGGSTLQFLNEHGDAKPILIRAYQCAIAEASEKHDAIFSSEQERLGEEFDANDSPPVRRAKGRLEHLKHALQRIVELPIEQTFSNFSRQILQ